MDYSQLSCLEIVIKLLEEKKEPTPIVEVMKEALKLKGLEDPDGSIMTRLYTDVVSSSLFVFCGEGKWDLKKDQPLEYYDRDGSYYGVKIEDDEEEDNLNPNYSDEDEDISDDDEDEDNYDDEEEDEEDESVREIDDYDEEDISDDEDDDDYLDEAKYNALMDDYEDMYDKD